MSTGDGDMATGECGYFPEGTYYGPQEQKEDCLILILPAAGARGAAPRGLSACGARVSRARARALGRTVQPHAGLAPGGKTGPLPRHGGFSVHDQVRIEAEDAEGRKKLAGTMLRAPMSLEKMTYDAQTGTVIYRSKMHLGLRGKGGAPSPPRELSGDARRPVAGVAVPAHPGSHRASGALRRLVLQSRTRGAGEGAQDSGCAGPCAGPVRFAHRARARTCERVRRARQVSLSAAHPQGLRSRSARMPEITTPELDAASSPLGSGALRPASVRERSGIDLPIR